MERVGLGGGGCQRYERCLYHFCPDQLDNSYVNREIQLRMYVPSTKFNIDILTKK